MLQSLPTVRVLTQSSIAHEQWSRNKGGQGGLCPPNIFHWGPGPPKFLLIHAHATHTHLHYYCPYHSSSNARRAFSTAPSSRAGRVCAQIFQNSVMATSVEPVRRAPYSPDIGWRFQRSGDQDQIHENLMSSM